MMYCDSFMIFTELGSVAKVWQKMLAMLKKLLMLHLSSIRVKEPRKGCLGANSYAPHRLHLLSHAVAEHLIMYLDIDLYTSEHP